MEKLHQKLKNRGNEPNIYILDNEVSSDLKLAMTDECVDWQLATPYLHRTNAAERAIFTFKNHFLAGLATTHPDLPISEWDRLLQQAVITLALLRNSRVNSKLSAHAYLLSPYNFTACPMAPPGTLVAVHIKPGKRRSWDPHCRRGWCVGPALHHYRNFRCYFPDTKSGVVSDTVDLFANNALIPTISHEEYIQQSLGDILAVLQSKKFINVPSLQYGHKINDAIILVSQLLGRASKKPTLQSAIPIQPRDPPEERISHISKNDKISTSRIPKSQPRVKTQNTVPQPRVKLSAENQLCSYKNLAQKYIQLKETFKLRAYHIYNEHGKRENLDTLLQKDPIIWGRALSNEWGRLAQEITMVF